MKQLEDYRSVRREIEEERQRLGSIRSDKGKSIAREIERKLRRLESEQADIERYVASIDDSLIRRIVIARYIECRSWEAVARKIGGYNTGETVRKMWQRWRHKNL